MEVTDLAAQAVRESGQIDGLCTVFVPHTTAGITINENADPDVVRDMITCLEDLVPRTFPFRHSEGNSDAHIKASLMGSNVVVPVVGGRLLLGTWQGIYLAEFDGPRTRKIHVTIQGGG